MKANPNLIAGIWTLLAVLILTFSYSAYVSNVRSNCAQTVVKSGSSATEAIKACQ